MSSADRKRLPIYDVTAPITCTLDASDVEARLELFECLRTNLVRLDRAEHGLLLHFPARADLEAELRHFADVEKQCCGFWGFDIEVADEITLRWDAPPAANDLVDRLVHYLQGDEPLTAISGLL